MKNVIAIIATIAVFGISATGIYLLLNPDLLETLEPKTTGEVLIVDGDYVEISKGVVATTYKFNSDDLNKFDFVFNNTLISYNDNSLSLDKEKIVSNIEIIDKFATYSDKYLIILFNNINNPFSGIVIYDMFKKKTEVITELDDMYVSIEDVYFEDLGFAFDLSRISDNNFYINDKVIDICDASNEFAASEIVDYYYDKVNEEFFDYEVLSSLSVDSYRTIEGICN